MFRQYRHMDRQAAQRHHGKRAMLSKSVANQTQLNSNLAS